MRMDGFEATVASAVLGAWLMALPGVVAAEGKPPNIILILADDMGYSDLGCYGGEIQTPNLDRLAANGIRFSQFFNSAKCEPTRASLMSGQYWQSCGLGIKQGVTMGQAMRLAGYDSFALGKWHLDGNPVERGFDRYFGHLSGASDCFKGNPSHHLDREPFKPKDDTFYTTDANADYAIQFIDEAHRRDPAKPFFLYLAFNAPHSPLQALPDDIAKYRGKYRIGWDVLREQRYRRLVEQGVMRPEWKLPLRPGTVPAWDSLTEEEQDFEDARMAVYAAMVDRMDQAIGRVLETVRKHGEEENTLVVFLSDNGASPYDHGPKRTADMALKGQGNLNVGLGWANLSATPFRHYKRNMFNGGSCTVCIASWPAVVKKTGTVTDQRAHIIDLMATFVEVGGDAWPQESDGKKIDPLPGKSLLPVLVGGERAPHDTLYFQLFDHRAVIAGDWKLVSDWNRPWELFNLKGDRTELNDLFAAQPEQAAHLAKLYDEWAKENVTQFKTAGGEPIYRHLNEADERFVGDASGERKTKAPKAGKGKKKKANE